MSTTYTLPKYPVYTNRQALDAVVDGVYRHEYTTVELEKLAQNLPDEVKRAIVRRTAGIAGEAMYCVRVAQEKARLLVEESFDDYEPEVTLQGTPVKAAEPLARDKALKILMQANTNFIKQSETIKTLDLQAITMDTIIAKVKEVLNQEQWQEFQVDLDRRITEATRGLMG